MSLYAVKNDEGEWLVVDRNGSDHWQASHGDIYSGWFSANDRVSVFGGHVVELVEAPAKVVVSEEEAEMLERAKNETFQEAAVIYHYAKNHDGWRLGNDIGDRLMRAYVNGWTVEKPKRWNVKVPHADKTLYRKHDSGALFASIYVGPQNHSNDFLFTLAEIEHYGLQDCEKTEVRDETD